MKSCLVCAGARFITHSSGETEECVCLKEDFGTRAHLYYKDLFDQNDLGIAANTRLERWCAICLSKLDSGFSFRGQKYKFLIYENFDHMFVLEREDGQILLFDIFSLYVHLILGLYEDY